MFDLYYFVLNISKKPEKKEKRTRRKFGEMGEYIWAHLYVIQIYFQSNTNLLVIKIPSNMDPKKYSFHSFIIKQFQQIYTQKKSNTNQHIKS